MNKQPTEKQIKKLCEWCGLRKDGNFWHDPEGKQLSEELPSIDLNSLFKWAVPNLQDKGEVISLIAYEHAGFGCRIASVFTTTGAHTMVEDKDPALALFWAISQAIIQRRIQPCKQ